MRWAAALLGIVAAALLIGLLTALLSSNAVDTYAPSSGMTLIEAHHCRPAETKHVLVRGIEDDYSSTGAEPARVHPRLAGLDLDVEFTAASFDSAPPDTFVTDFFEFPAGIVSGLIVIKMRPNGDNANDHVSIGDFETRLRSTPPDRSRVYNDELRRLALSKGWKSVRDLYWVSMADLPLNAGETVLDLATAARGSRIVDITVGEDTVVDFVAAVACERPKTRAGVTLVHREATPANGIAAFACKGFFGIPDCNPYAGDHSCSARLPLLCHRDRNLAAPLSDSVSNDANRFWTGGEVAATPPVAGDSFKTIAEADAHCASHLDAGWRVAEWHMGGGGWNLTARSGGRTFAGRYWIDIRNQPYATCWRREG